MTDPDPDLSHAREFRPEPDVKRSTQAAPDAKTLRRSSNGTFSVFNSRVVTANRVLQENARKKSFQGPSRSPTPSKTTFSGPSTTGKGRCSVGPEETKSELKNPKRGIGSEKPNPARTEQETAPDMDFDEDR